MSESKKNMSRIKYLRYVQPFAWIALFQPSTAIDMQKMPIRGPTLCLIACRESRQTPN